MDRGMLVCIRMRARGLAAGRAAPGSGRGPGAGAAAHPEGLSARNWNSRRGDLPGVRHADRPDPEWRALRSFSLRGPRLPKAADPGGSRGAEFARDLRTWNACLVDTQRFALAG